MIKELMLESLKQSSHLPEVNPLQPTENFRRNMSLVSLLTDNSGAYDGQLAYYAKVMEQTRNQSVMSNDTSDSSEYSEGDQDKETLAPEW